MCVVVFYLLIEQNVSMYTFEYLPRNEQIKANVNKISNFWNISNENNTYYFFSLLLHKVKEKMSKSMILLNQLFCLIMYCKKKNDTNDYITEF